MLSIAGSCVVVSVRCERVRKTQDRLGSREIKGVSDSRDVDDVVFAGEALVRRGLWPVCVSGAFVRRRSRGALAQKHVHLIGWGLVRAETGRNRATSHTESKG